MTSQIKLKQPIINGSLRATNFFNGRLVTGADLTREQTARREAVWRLGKAIGEGIVYGLEVEKDSNAGANPVVSVKRGLAVSRCGQALYLADDASVDLLQRFGAVSESSTIFGDCQPLAVGTYAAGYGFYLLVLSPAESSEGSAPTSGLNNAFSTCNTDVILETVQFNLLPVDTVLKNDTLPNPERLRNYLAYRCFGVAKSPNFFKDPLGFSINSYGLIDELRGKLLSSSDVPLALIHWTSKGLQFVENWAVRRRISRTDEDDDWTQIIKDRRLSESEAMMMQFADQIENLESEGANLPAIVAAEHFRYLPPAGILPVVIPGSAGKPGFNPPTFFGAKNSTPAELNGDLLPVLLEQALSHEPIDLTSGDKIQLYQVKENVSALSGTSIRKILVFARHTLPYLGKPVPVIVTKPETLTFAPDFLPINQRMPQQFDWLVTFNKAVVPTAANQKDDTAKGSFTIRFPNTAQIKKMIVRFKRIGDEGNPTEFLLSLNRLEFDNPNAIPEVLINFDLKTLGYAFKETRPIKSSVLGQVDNSKYLYFISAVWKNAGGSDRFEINSMQIFCDLQE